MPRASEELRESRVWDLMEQRELAEQSTRNRANAAIAGFEIDTRGTPVDLDGAYDQATTTLLAVAEQQEKLTNGESANGDSIIIELLTVRAGLANQASGDYARTASDRIQATSALAQQANETARAIHDDVYKAIPNTRYSHLHEQLEALRNDEELAYDLAFTDEQSQQVRVGPEQFGAEVVYYADRTGLSQAEVIRRLASNSTETTNAAILQMAEEATRLESGSLARSEAASRDADARMAELEGLSAGMTGEASQEIAELDEMITAVRADTLRRTSPGSNHKSVFSDTGQG